MLCGVEGEGRVSGGVDAGVAAAEGVVSVGFLRGGRREGGGGGVGGVRG